MRSNNKEAKYNPIKFKTNRDSINRQIEQKIRVQDQGYYLQVKLGQSGQSDLHVDYVELQTKPIRQQKREPEEPRSNKKTSFEPGADTRQPAAASLNEYICIFTIQHEIKNPNKRI